jgi:aflatoxin B1 aldehyde reductase
MESLKALRCKKVHIFYLHAPDRTVPIEDTLQTINDLYDEGHLYVCLCVLHFPSSTCVSEQFGLSNYNSWEVCDEPLFLNKQTNAIHPFTQVAEIMGIMKQNNWVRPTVYQGGYNAVKRNVEVE